VSVLAKFNFNLEDRVLFEGLFDGEDLAPYIGVVKWDPPVPANLAGNVKGAFPPFIPKTDQERIQNCYQSMQRRFLDDLFEVTLKLDGSSMTAFVFKDEFGVCSRNMQLKIDEENIATNAYVSTAVHIQLEHVLRNSGFSSIAIQGELMGPGVQGNREQLHEKKFYVFDMFNIETQKYFAPEFVRKFCYDNALDHVPVINPHMSLRWKSCADILKMADDTPSIKNPISEGLVFKSVHDASVSFKAISNKYLLEE